MNNIQTTFKRLLTYVVENAAWLFAPLFNSSNRDDDMRKLMEKNQWKWVQQLFDVCVCFFLVSSALRNPY